MMPQMNITIMNIFTTQYKLITVKKIILIIEMFTFTPKIIKGFMELFLRQCSKQGLDNSIHLIRMVYI